MLPLELIEPHSVKRVASRGAASTSSVPYEKFESITAEMLPMSPASSNVADKLRLDVSARSAPTDGAPAECADGAPANCSSKNASASAASRASTAALGSVGGKSADMLEWKRNHSSENARVFMDWRRNVEDHCQEEDEQGQRSHIHEHRSPRCAPPPPPSAQRKGAPRSNLAPVRPG